MPFFLVLAIPAVLREGIVPEFQQFRVQCRSFSLAFLSPGKTFEIKGF
jgi:hypothetical protein